MKSFLIAFVVLFFFVCGALFFMYQFHLVKASDGFHVVSKDKGTFEDFYLDATKWGLLDYAKYPRISGKLITDKLEEITAELNKAFSEMQNEAEKALARLEKDLEGSSQLEDKIKDLNTSFQRELKALNDQLKKADTEKAIRDIRKKKEALMEWLNKEIAHLKREFSK